VSTTTLVLLVVLALVLVVIAAVVAAAETAFTRVNRSRADALAAAEAEDHAQGDDPDERVEELQGFSRRPLTMLASLTLVQVLCQVTAAAVSFTVGRELGGRVGGYTAAGVCLAVMFFAVATSRSRALLAPDTRA